MHPAQRDFIVSVRTLHPEFFSRSRVLEFGSYNINGSIRDLFADCVTYEGVDWRPGPCVDVVSLCHQFESEQEYDVLISSEMLEHDPHWQASLIQGVAHLRPGGLVVLTCASPERKAHEVYTAPVEGHYEGVGLEELGVFLETLGVHGAAISGDGGKDTYFHGFKK